MTTIELSVPTVHCRSCKLNIEESLEDVPGVRASTVDLDAKRGGAIGQRADMHRGIGANTAARASPAVSGCPGRRRAS